MALAPISFAPAPFLADPRQGAIPATPLAAAPVAVTPADQTELLAGMLMAQNEMAAHWTEFLGGVGSGQIALAPIGITALGQAVVQPVATQPAAFGSPLQMAQLDASNPIISGIDPLAGLAPFPGISPFPAGTGPGMLL